MDLDNKEPGTDSDSETVKRKKESKHKKSSKSQKDGVKERHKDRDSSSAKEMSQSKRDPIKMDSGISLWDLALQQVQQSNGTLENQTAEKSIVFVGGKASGKTTVILRFLDHDEAPKPTTALEYTFGRKAIGNNLDKDVAHIWELGGGTWLSKLADVVVGSDALLYTCVALVLDLSKPNELWLTLEKWLEVLKARVEAIIQEAREKDFMLREQLKKEAWNRVGEDHADYDLLDPFLLPLVIIGTKYDVFQDFDAEKRKVICKSLRFVAHKYGSCLQFCSKHESLLSKTRAIVSHFVFGTAMSRTLQTDYNKPLSIAAGQDSFQEIGAPPLQDGDVGRLAAKTPWDLWKHAYTKHFPQEITADPSLVDDPAKDKQFSETAVDTMRVQKDEELVRYRRASERRAKEAFNKPILEGMA